MYNYKALYHKDLQSKLSGLRFTDVLTKSETGIPIEHGIAEGQSTETAEVGVGGGQGEITISKARCKLNNRSISVNNKQKQTKTNPSAHEVLKCILHNLHSNE